MVFVKIKFSLKPSGHNASDTSVYPGIHVSITIYPQARLTTVNDKIFPWVY